MPVFGIHNAHRGQRGEGGRRPRGNGVSIREDGSDGRCRRADHVAKQNRRLGARDGTIRLEAECVTTVKTLDIAELIGGGDIPLRTVANGGIIRKDGGRYGGNPV